MDLRPLACVCLVILGGPWACIIEDDTCQTGRAHDFRCSLADDSSGTLEGGTDSAACTDTDGAAIVRVENRTGNAIDVVYFVRCDGSDPSEFPLTPPGLPDGEDVEIPLPGPGCWLLDYSGEGCQGDMPHTTEMDVCAGATYVWTPDDLNHVCVG